MWSGQEYLIISPLDMFQIVLHVSRNVVSFYEFIYIYLYIEVLKSVVVCGISIKITLVPTLIGVISNDWHLH